MAKKKWKQEQKQSEEKVLEKPASVVEVPKEPLVEFDAWYASRASRIPSQHHKEILWADFKARGLKKMALMNEYDEALKKYGVQLA